jgi:hypothetical protein
LILGRTLPAALSSEGFGQQPMRSAMERPMTLWKTETYNSLPKLPATGRYLDLVALVGVAALPGLLFTWLMPMPFIPPAICVVSFLIACAFGWFAHHTGASRRATEVTAWDMAGIFTLIWVGAGLASDHTHLVQLFEFLAKGA